MIDEPKKDGVSEKPSEESVGQTPKKSYTPPEAPKKVEDSNPLGEGVKIAFYVVYHEKFGDYGVIGAQGFLDEPARAYYALKCVEKNLDEFYFKKNSFRENFMAGVRSFRNKMNFRGFIRGK